jgi:hypothetical protein
MLKETMNDKLIAEYAAEGIDIIRLHARDMKHDYYLCKYKSEMKCNVFLQIHRNTKYVRFLFPNDFHKLEDRKHIFIIPVEE